MDVLEFLVVRFVLFILPLIVFTSLGSKIELDFWWILMPTMWSIFISVFLPRKVKWVFRYLVPVIYHIIYTAMITASNLAQLVNQVNTWRCSVTALSL